MACAVRQYIKNYVEMTALKRVYAVILHEVMKGSVNKFFDFTPIGTLMNRFNNDMSHFGHIVEEVVSIMFQLTDFMMMMYTVSCANSYFLFLVPFVIGYFVYIYMFTLKSM